MSTRTRIPLRTATAALALATAAVVAAPARAAEGTERISVGPAGAGPNGPSFEPAVSADGRFVAFSSWASNLVPGDTNDADDVFVRDRRTRETTRVSVGPGGAQSDGDQCY